MSLNLTATWLEAHQAPVLLSFANMVGTTSTGLAGAGGITANGYPLPGVGVAKKLFVWDQTSLRTATGSIPVYPGDRVSLYATYSGGTFTVELICNGSPTGLLVGNCQASTTLQATLLIQLKE